jgi:hypothetical protein
VCEAAAKALVKQGGAAVLALRAQLADKRPFVRIIAAQGLGQRAEASALSELVKMTQESDTLSRLAALRARVVRALLDALADRSSLVTAAAERALTESYQTPKEVLMEDVVLYGAQRPAAVVEQLQAGPMRLKFQDGELRSLYVGDREIVRRMYFAVRDSRWDTVMPEFDQIEVKRSAGGFRIQFAARCRNDVADYSWKGEIVGAPEGKIIFNVSGAPNADFNSPRVGVNVLFGSDALAGVSYETADATGKVVPGTFPTLISPALLTGKWTGLSYRIGDLGVTCQVTDADFGMEDQRNYGDSSYKAYSGLAYKYPKLTKGDRQKETVELSVIGGPAPTAVPDSVRVRIGLALPGAARARVVPPPGRHSELPGDRSDAERRGGSEHVLQSGPASAGRGYLHGEPDRTVGAGGQCASAGTAATAGGGAIGL